jgi:hypothetical protein
MNTEDPQPPDASAGEMSADGVSPLLNAAEARNLAYLVSHHLSRNRALRLTSAPVESAGEVATLATTVATRLADLSLRLASDETRAQLANPALEK